MTLLLRDGPVKSPSSEVSRFIEPVLSGINGDAYDAAGALAIQRSNLENLGVINTAEDLMRVRVHQLIERQREAIVKRDLPLALELNREAERLLAVVDMLDEAQGLDAGQALSDAERHRRDAQGATKRIIARTEPSERRRLLGPGGRD